MTCLPNHLQLILKIQRRFEHQLAGRLINFAKAGKKALRQPVLAIKLSRVFYCPILPPI